MSQFEHLRHKPPSELVQARELLLVVSPLRSSVNLSRMVRLAGCAGVTQIVYCGQGKVDPKIARDASEVVEVQIKRSLPPVLKKLREEGYCLVGLEQTTNSHRLFNFSFPRRTALVIGAEREGLTVEALEQLHEVVEIPVYGQPASYNVVTATTMAVYEYMRQFPAG